MSTYRWPTEGHREIERQHDVGPDPALHVACRRCGKDVVLWWNGGELDSRECCGLVYSLEHGPVDLVIYGPPPEGQP